MIKHLFGFIGMLLPLLSAGATADKLSLNSAEKIANWRVKAQVEIGKDSISIYKEGYDISSWVKAIVPGTVFGSFVEVGLEKDPNYADNAYNVDKSKYDRNFWYRTEFTTSSLPAGEKIWLNFEGINRKAEIFFNENRIGELDGFMERGKFDITDLLKKEGNNVLAVLVYWPTLPIPNYASPTYISSASWDWMPYVPGLLSGITDDVYISTSGPVSLIDPWVRTKVPNPDEADLSLQFELKNHTGEKQKGILKGVIQPGDIKFSQVFNIDAGKQRTFQMDSKWCKQLHINKPELWWPNGYGEPNLYTCNLQYVIDDKVSDQQDFSFGIREYSYDSEGGVFHLSVNGTRIYVKGGNWGMSEYMLRCRGEEYDLKVKLHKDMHYNMIRNWIGSTTDEEFYEACDKYGIMVWDDFWLNSHPNLPDDVFVFNKNAVEKIKRLRNHPCIAVWCGDNEGVPLPPLNGWLKENVAVYDGNDRYYHANSREFDLSGSGPWTNGTPEWYFTKYPGGFGDHAQKGWGFRTEIGTAVFTTFESFKKFIPEEYWWPRNEMWNKHFFGSSAGNASPDKYFSTVNENYGDATGIKDFCRKAQLLNLEVNKAMYEGWQHHMWEDAAGILTWMSQSAYPSFVWQTYDYYYDLNGAYWGVKKACEPLHIQWSPADNSVKVINSSSYNYAGLKVIAEIYNLDGSMMKTYNRTAEVNSSSNTTSFAFNLLLPAEKQKSDLSAVYFIKLKLIDNKGIVLSDNFYWKGTERGNYQALNKLPKTKLAIKSKMQTKGGKNIIHATIKNTGSSVAFCVRVTPVRSVDGERILPIMMNDNYFTLLKGETKNVDIEFDTILLKEGNYHLLVEPYN